MLGSSCAQENSSVAQQELLHILSALDIPKIEYVAPELVLSLADIEISSLPPKKIRTSIDEAVKIAKLDDLETQDFVIYWVDADRVPEDRDYEVEYIVLHGGANPNETSLIHEGVRSGHYAFAILKNGAIFQFFDEGLPSGGVGGYSRSSEDALINYKAIAIEFSAERIEGAE